METIFYTTGAHLGGLCLGPFCTRKKIITITLREVTVQEIYTGNWLQIFFNLRGVQGVPVVRYLTFWTAGTIPHFFGLKGEEFAVNRGDQQWLDYNKTVFGWGSASNPACDSSRRSPRPPSPIGVWESSPFSSPLSSLDPRASHSPSELIPHFFDQSYAHVDVPILWVPLPDSQILPCNI